MNVSYYVLQQQVFCLYIILKKRKEKHVYQDILIKNNIFIVYNNQRTQTKFCFPFINLLMWGTEDNKG